ncbi:MAG: hypothetical protein BGO07_04345 [Alphaproteobacteria bacterium 40-19]|nr:MAG: hypothetical protein BGO07_04345 [Alphaproteobacteria bacterium 40-19]
MIHKKDALSTLFKKATGQKDALILMQACCAVEDFNFVPFTRFLNSFDSEVLFKPLIYSKLIKSKEGTACLLQKARDFSEQFSLLKKLLGFTGSDFTPYVDLFEKLGSGVIFHASILPQLVVIPKMIPILFQTALASHQKSLMQVCSAVQGFDFKPYNRRHFFF